jgi:putative acetyltransferase
MEVIIKPAQEIDLDNVWQIYAEAVGRSAARKDEYWQNLIQAGGMIVAQINNQIVGFGAIDLIAREQIKYVYIAPKFQKLGIGVMILGKLEEIGEQAGFDELLLHANPQAVDFYKRAGYTAIENKIDHDHEGVQMIKRFR